MKTKNKHLGKAQWKRLANIRKFKARKAERVRAMLARLKAREEAQRQYGLKAA